MDSTAQKPDLKAVPTSVKEIEFQETSLDIWESKYCLKTKKGDHEKFRGRSRAGCD